MDLVIISHTFNIYKMYYSLEWMPGLKHRLLYLFLKMVKVNSIPLFPHPSRESDCTRKLKNVSDTFCAKLNRMCYYGVVSLSDVVFACVHSWSCLCVTLSEYYLYTF